MANTMFIKEPGHIYDLFFAFMLHFNKETMIERCINYNKAAEDTEYLKSLSSDVSQIARELYLFFYLPNGNKNCFITEYYYAPYIAKFSDEYNLDFVQNELSDYDRVISNVIKYYFGDVTDANSENHTLSIKEIAKLTSASDYSGDVKAALLSFFIDPIPVIQKLSVELLSMDFLIKKKFDNYASVLTEIQKKPGFEILPQKLSELPGFDFCTDELNKIVISPCQAAKNTVQVYCENGKNNAVILLGENFDSYIDYLINKNSVPELSVFGTAICDKNRVDMLNLIYRDGQVTIKDIENELMLTGTNAYYHISLMLKANILKSRSEGRNVFYSINDNIFHAISKTFEGYADKN